MQYPTLNFQKHLDFQNKMIEKTPELILQNVARHIAIDEDSQTVFLSLLEYKKVKKKALVLREGEVSHHSIFVSSGCLRGYTLDTDGVEHILQFAPPDWWIADMYSFITGKPGDLYIDALAESEIWLLSKSNRELLFEKVPAFERFFRILIENSLVAYRRRVVENLSMSAKARYQVFCERYPGLIERVPLKMVASYIGVTPEFLSKLRAG